MVQFLPLAIHRNPLDASTRENWILTRIHVNYTNTILHLFRCSNAR